MSTKQEIVSDAAFKAWPFSSDFNLHVKKIKLPQLLAIGCKPYHYQVANSSTLNEAEF